jgi:hypothetical protein
LKGIFNVAIEPRGCLAEGQNPFAKLKKRKIAQEPIRYVNVEEYHALKEEARSLWWKAGLPHLNSQFFLVFGQYFN